MTASILTPAQLATSKTIVAYLMVGLPSNSAIAFAGNFFQESSFDPLASGDGGVSVGLGQWQGDRLTNLKTWCSNSKLDSNSIEGQCRFTLYEYPTADGVGATRAAWFTDTSNNGQPKRSLVTLTADVSAFYERPGNPMLDNRISYAQQIATFLGTTLYTPTEPIVTGSQTLPTIAFLADFMALLQKYGVTVK